MTTFPFNDGIPAAGNNPSSDQPIMRTNNQSIKAILAIDHVTFEATNGGLHNQVTFNSIQSAPGFPSGGVAVLFTNSDGSFTNAPWWQYSASDSGRIPVQASATNLITNGTYKLVNGLRIEWGSSSFAASTSGTINFSSSFLSIFTVIGTPLSAKRQFSITGFTTANFSWETDSTITDFNWIAIGI